MLVMEVKEDNWFTISVLSLEFWIQFHKISISIGTFFLSASASIRATTCAPPVDIVLTEFFAKIKLLQRDSTKNYGSQKFLSWGNYPYLNSGWVVLEHEARQVYQVGQEEVLIEQEFGQLLILQWLILEILLSSFDKQLPCDPFQVLDYTSAAQLVAVAVPKSGIGHE